MRTEKEIRYMLAIYEKDLENIKAEYKKYMFAMNAEQYLSDICDIWTEIESKINTLMWVLGEY